VNNRETATIIALNDVPDINEIVNSAAGTVYFFDQEQFTAYQDNPKIQFIQLSEAEKKDINYDTLEKLKSMAKVNYEGKPLLDRLTVEKFSFWYYNRFRIYFDTRNVRYQAALVDQLLEKHDRLTIHTHYAGLKDYFINDDRVTVQLHRTHVKQEREFRYLFNFSMSVIARSFVGLFKLRRFRKHEHIIITTPTQFSKTRKEKRSSINNYYGGILENTDKHNVAVIDQLMFPKLRGKNPIVRIGHILHTRPYMVLGGEFIVCFYALIRPSVWRTVKQQRRQLKLAYGVLDLQYHAYKRLFRKGSIKTLTTIDENSPNPKSILDAAKAQGITTIGIQHGSIHNLHPAYMYAAYEERFYPVPHYTLLWGDYFKELLVNDSAYDAEQLDVIGQLRLDSLFTDEFKSSDRSAKYFTEGKTSVLFASQPQRDPILRKRAAIDVINSCKDLKDVELIIKIHPNEDKDYYKNLANSLNANVTVLKNEANLYHILMRCNVVITCFSTVGAEAIFLRKPLIILDHLEQDVLGYISRGAARKATSANELTERIEELIKEDFKIDEESYDKFIADFACKIDGKVAERYFDYLNSLSPQE
jgi:hypothetical protein